MFRGFYSPVIYRDYFKSRYKNPYEPIRIQWFMSAKGSTLPFLRCLRNSIYSRGKMVGAPLGWYSYLQLFNPYCWSPLKRGLWAPINTHVIYCVLGLMIFRGPPSQRGFPSIFPMIYGCVFPSNLHHSMFWFGDRHVLFGTQVHDPPERSAVGGHGIFHTPL